MTRNSKPLAGVALIAALLLTGCGASETIADDVWSNVEEAYPDGFDAGSPLAAVNKVEDVSDGTIRVYVQLKLTDADRQDIADQVHGLGYVEDLDTIVIRDASGLDSNHFFD